MINVIGFPALIVRSAVVPFPFKVAVMASTKSESTTVVVMLKVAVVPPAGIVTVAVGDA